MTSKAIFQVPCKDNKERLSDSEAMKMSENRIWLYLDTYTRCLVLLRIPPLTDNHRSKAPYEDSFAMRLVRCLHLAPRI